MKNVQFLEPTNFQSITYDLGNYNKGYKSKTHKVQKKDFVPSTYLQSYPTSNQTITTKTTKSSDKKRDTFLQKPLISTNLNINKTKKKNQFFTGPVSFSLPKVIKKETTASSYPQPVQTPPFVESQPQHQVSFKLYKTQKTQPTSTKDQNIFKSEPIHQYETTILSQLQQQQSILQPQPQFEIEQTLTQQIKPSIRRRVQQQKSRLQVQQAQSRQFSPQSIRQFKQIKQTHSQSPLFNPATIAQIQQQTTQKTRQTHSKKTSNKNEHKFDIILFQSQKEEPNYKVYSLTDNEQKARILSSNKTTQTSQYISTEPNYDEDRINRIEGDTNTLRNEHQKIRNTLNVLSTEINSYKNHLSLLEKKKAQKEVDALRAENEAMKQQLSQLGDLRRKVDEVNDLKLKLAELDPLRKKAALTDIMRNQLREYNDIKSKVEELSNVKSKLRELNQLRAQVNQMNNVEKQIDELNSLRKQASEGDNIRRKIEQMENKKIEYQQEIENLRTSQKIELLKMRNSRESIRQSLFGGRKTINIKVKGDIIHNMKELEFITKNIIKPNKKVTLNLLYKATVDSDKAYAFHQRCDKAESSLVLIETNKGKRFGGFTTCNWRGNCIDKKDEEAFVFSLDKMKIYANIPEEDAIGCYPTFGPIFLGCQIKIYDNAFIKGGTTYEKGCNFETEEDFELTGGERVFGVKEIEVYEVIA